MFWQIFLNTSLSVAQDWDVSPDRQRLGRASHAVFDHAGSLSCKYPSSLSLGGTDSALHEVSKNPLNPRILETRWLSDYSLGWLWPCLMSISELGATPPRWSFFMPKLARRGPTRFTVRWRRRQGREKLMLQTFHYFYDRRSKWANHTIVPCFLYYAL